MHNRIKQVVILAGGLGTRLQPFTNDTPKPMFPIHGIPFLTHLLRQVKDFGIDKVVLLLGYKSEKIMSYYQDGKNLGLTITYCVTPVEYDTGARIRQASDLLEKEFLLLYCDNYCPINMERKIKRFSTEDALVQITAYSNKDGYTKNNLQCVNGQVIHYDKQRLAENLNGVDIGYALVKKEVLQYLPNGNVNFEKEIYPILVKENKLAAYMTDHRYYSIGSYERIEQTKEFFMPKKAVFLDRDGTINVRAEKGCYIEKKEDFAWLTGAKEAIRILKQKGYMVFLFTNQPGIARGKMTEKDLDEIHNKLLNDLQKVGTSIDKIYVCPHGWNDGCECRKPRPGMLYQAQKEYALNLLECIVIGDDERDIQAGEEAGCQCFHVTTEQTLIKIVRSFV